MADFVAISIEGDLTIAPALLRVASPEVIGRANKRIAEYIKKRAETYPKQKSITRKQAYGKSFESDKQRRFFFSALARGEIVVPYQRTDTFKLGWQVVPFGVQDFIVINDVPYGGFLMGIATRANMMKLIGWKTLEGIADKVASDQAILIMLEEIEKEINAI